MSIAMYAGSFDPITNGHLDLIERGARLYERLVVAVGNNPSKRYLFDIEERLDLARRATREVPNIEVVTFQGLLVTACANYGAEVILRGLRATSDFEIEFRNGLANREMSGIETVFLLTDPQNIFLSSSLVKEIALNGGDVSRYVPAVVAEALSERARSG